MKENNLASINITELDQFNKEYKEYALRAHKDQTPESDYNAALRAPAAFLRKPSNLEACFDKILFHLDEAYRKNSEENNRLAISRCVDEMFHEIIVIITARIAAIEKENSRGLFQKISDSATRFIKRLGENSNEIEASPWAGLALTAAPEVGNLTLAFFDYLSNKWELGSEESCFYNQLANVYQKVLDSKSFNSQFGLIRNTFTTNKENILSYVVKAKGLTAAQNLLKYDKTASEVQESSRIIVAALAECGEWEQGADFLHTLQVAKLANYRELRTDFINKFEEAIEAVEGKKEADLESQEKALIENYPTAAAISYRINADEVGYKKYMARRKVYDVIAGIVSLVFICGLILGGILFYKSEKESYVASASNEETRISTAIRQSNLLIQSKDFRAANDKIREISWTAEKLFFSGKDEERIDAVRQERMALLLDAMLATIAEKSSEGMGEANYKYVNQEVLPAYSAAVAQRDFKLQKQYREKLKSQVNALDQARNRYLDGLQIEIERKAKSKDIPNALKLVDGLYHLSEEPYKGGNMLTKLIKDSYKTHWEKERDSLMEKLKKG